jgi:DNA (cytosine-5)-methyltransferase 1
MSLLDRIKMALGIRSPSKEFPKPFIPEHKGPPQAELCGGSMERTSEPMTYKLGSLFDGSGGFPLAGSLCGIVPVWAAEVEPYPIAVTRSRFPNMRHLGDISKVNGAEIEPVDVITFGSPCQDLSVAGKRAGLKHADNGDEETTRSGLFMEAVRIIKEMREATNGNYPRFALWENVPGAFSSNKGEDFKTVCEELIKIVEPAAVMPAVPKNGWPYADSYCGDRWSLAYRVFDAQYWGVPQRRRRIHLIVDFTGQCARNVLFERPGVRGYFEAGRTPWQGIAAAPQDGTGATDCQGIGLDIYNHAVTGRIAASLTTATGQGAANTGPSVAVPYTLKIRSGCEGGGKGALVQEDKSATLATNNDQYLFQPMSLREENWAESGVKNAIRAGESKSSHAVVQAVVDGNILDDQGGQQITVRTDGKSPTLRAEMHGNIPCVMQAAGFKAGNGAKANGIGYEEEVAPTLSAAPSGTNQAPTIVCKEQYLFENHSQDTRYKGPMEVCPMLPAQLGTGGNNTPFVVEAGPAYSIQGNTIDRNAQQNGSGICENVSHTINAVDRHGVAYGIGNGQANQSFSEELVGALNCMHDQQAVAYGVDCRNATEYPELNGTLQAKSNGGFSLNCNQIVRTCYIVRRLTPTECARLQGFADQWGNISNMEALNPENLRFWQDVRNTHAAINGKAVKEYTEKQMLTWYNKLHTDSAEYKMWGNGIALPPALYCMQGIADALGGVTE